jgi:GNAT superfamily N-acetyltransferase
MSQPPAGSDPREIGTITIQEVLDESGALAEGTLALIAASFAPHERHPLSELRSEIAEKRLELLLPFDFHLFSARMGGRVIAAAAGVYLAGVNAGFVTYLTVHPSGRSLGLGTRVRDALTAAFEENARDNGRDELNWILGEVRLSSPWLITLLRERGAVAFDLEYYHPGMSLHGTGGRYVLYREPMGDRRGALPTAEVRRVLYAIWRRAYRVRYPLERETFQDMLAQLEGRGEVGPRDFSDK